MTLAAAIDVASATLAAKIATGIVEGVGIVAVVVAAAIASCGVVAVVADEAPRYRRCMVANLHACKSATWSYTVGELKSTTSQVFARIEPCFVPSFPMC